jgi:flagellar biosynthesis/type III secretory pathway protein FliH
MAIITCNENNIADGLHQAYEEGYHQGYCQGRIDEAEHWKYEVTKLRSEYEELKKDLQLQYMTKVF